MQFQLTKNKISIDNTLYLQKGIQKICSQLASKQDESNLQSISENE